MQLRKRTLSRLLAVQALYHWLFLRHNLMVGEEIPPQDWMAYAAEAQDVLQRDFGLKRTSYEESLYTEIVEETLAHMDELETWVEECLKDGKTMDRLELILQALLLAAAYEARYRLDVPTPVLVEEYLNLTHAFFTQQESRLVHGVLSGLGAKRTMNLPNEGL